MDFQVGNTPLVKVGKKIFAKLECKNPAGSTKDRVALQMILDAEKEGKLQPGATVVEATSGNTGIGLAAVCQAKEYKCKIFMPENMSKQRISMIEKYGAECVLTNKEKGMQGSVDQAQSFVENNDKTWLASQFENPSNWKAHYLTTGPEIWAQMDGNIDVFIAGIGTGGSITGIGWYLKEQDLSIKIIGIEPAGSAVLSGKPAGAHEIQGIGAGFIPKVLDRKIYDEIITVEDKEAFVGMEALNFRKFGCAGISSGAAYCVAKRLAKTSKAAQRIVILCPDGADRY